MYFVVNWAIAILLANAFLFLLGRHITRQERRGGDRADRSPSSSPSPRSYRHLDPFFGLDKYYAQGKALLSHCYLGYQQLLHVKYGRTFQSKTTKGVSITSADPQNIREVFWGKDWVATPSTFEALEWCFPFAPDDRRKLDLALPCGPHRRSACWEDLGVLPNSGSGSPPGDDSDAVVRKKSLDCWRSMFMYGGSWKRRLDVLDICFQLMLARIPRNGKTVDLQPLFQDLFLDFGAKLFLGSSLGALDRKDVDSPTPIRDALHEVFRWRSLKRAFGPLEYLIPDLKIAGTCDPINKLVDYYVEAALKYGQEHASETEDWSKDLPDDSAATLHIMAKIERRPPILRLMVVRNLSEMLIRGVILNNIFHALARCPNIWRKARSEELDLENCETRPLGAFVSIVYETLRLYPIFPEMSRSANIETKLPIGGGIDGRLPFTCAAGTEFHASLYVLNRLPDIFGADANTFRPQRWNEGERESKRIFLELSNGVQLDEGLCCILLDVAYVFEKMMREFYWIEPRREGNEDEWAGDVHCIAQNLHGCKVGLFGQELMEEMEQGRVAGK